MGKPGFIAAVEGALAARAAVDKISDHEVMGMHVVLVGNPIDGITIYGPFKTAEDAASWASFECIDEDWCAAPLHSPDVQKVVIG